MTDLVLSVVGLVLLTLVGASLFTVGNLIYGNNYRPAWLRTVSIIYWFLIILCAGTGFMHLGIKLLAKWPE